MGIEFLPIQTQINKINNAFEILKNKLMQSRVVIEPSPHIFLNKALDENLLKILWDDLPKDIKFVLVEEGGNILRNYAIQSYVWNAYDAFIRHILICLFPKFREWLEIKNNQLLSHNMSCSWIRQYGSFICFNDPKKGVPPHMDGESSVLNIITVLGYPDGSMAPVTNFFSKDKSSGIYFPTTQYSPSRGSIFVWLNLNNAYHGVIEKIYPKRLTHIASLESYERNND